MDRGGGGRAARARGRSELRRDPGHRRQRRRRDVDWRDVDGLEEAPDTECFETVGPLTDPPAPERGTRAWLFATVVPHGWPLAFTNPLAIDRDGDGYEGVSRLFILRSCFLGAWRSPTRARRWTHAMPVGPVQAGLLDGELGLARRVCPRTELGLGGGGYVLAEPENFYGYLHGEAALSGSYALGDDTELFARIEPVRWQSVLGAIPSDHLGLGWTSLGATQRLVVSEDLALGITGRAVLPTAVGLYRCAVPFALDVGLTGTWAASNRVEVHAGARRPRQRDGVWRPRRPPGGPGADGGRAVAGGEGVRGGPRSDGRVRTDRARRSRGGGAGVEGRDRGAPGLRARGGGAAGGAGAGARGGGARARWRR